MLTWEFFSGRRYKAQNAVVGTCWGSNPDGKKMKTARADIFIYAVDNSTTVDDILDDLAYHKIEVNSKQVVKKTRAGVESRFDCNRITVK